MATEINAAAGWMSVGSSLVQAYGAYESGQSAKRQAEFTNLQTSYAAKVARQDALDRAQMIRRAGDRAVGAASTVTAANGLVVGQGSAGDVEREIYTQSEHDAYTTLLTGSRAARGYDVAGAVATAGGAQSATNANNHAIGSVLAGGYTAARSWGITGGNDAAGWFGTARAKLTGSYNENYGNESNRTSWFSKTGQ